MDTITFNLQMAMGQGEQQAIHPFFRKDVGIAANPPPAPGDSVLETPANAPARDLSTENPHPLQSTVGHCETSLPRIDSSSSVATLDEDLNSSRRKRRRTENPRRPEQDAVSRTGLSAWLGHSASDTTSSPVTVETPADPESCPVPFQKQPLPANTQIGQDTTSSPQTVEEGSDRTSRRKRTLKLNANGRLLSSPPASQSRDAVQKSTGSKRGRPRKAENKVVVMKYSTEEGRGIGRLIDDIFNGRKVLRPSTERPAARPAVAETKPPKPTHPFFLKQSSQKSTSAEPPAAQHATSDSESKASSNPSQIVCQEKKRQDGTPRPSFTTFGHRISKFPELIDPLWPPRDLVHVRGESSNDIAPICVRTDQKKSKVAAVRITDDENVLSAISSFVETQDAPAVLRLPKRQLVSGPTLQAAMDRQMSWTLPNNGSAWDSRNPAIAKLRSALLSSASAFDRGRYESQLWSQKYAPKSADDVLQAGREVHVLREWLLHLKITAVDTGKPSKDSAKANPKVEKKRKKRRKQTDKLDGFIVSSDEEAVEMDNLSGSDDELAGEVTVSSEKTLIRSGDLTIGCHRGGEKGRLTNAILLSGPSGCGKTASVYAVAKELDFEVFEINAGSRRSARDMLERVGDMTQNHLVHLLNETEESAKESESSDGGKQNKLMNFFKTPWSNGVKANVRPARASPKPDADTRRSREQKQSLILLEEADILFDDDKQFWTGIMALISQSRRPIVITCNDESLVPLQDLSLNAILRYRIPPQDLVVDYLLLVAANEGHMLKRDAVAKLYAGSGMDLRRALMDLNFWCQMGVGSEKSGLDWILPRWPRDTNEDQSGDRSRVISLNTYEGFMGWFNRDLFLSQHPVDRDTEALRNTFDWWGLGVQESEDKAELSEAEALSPSQFQATSKAAQLDLLGCEAEYLDMRSSLDILCRGCPLNAGEDAVDTSDPPLPEGHRLNYTEGYPVVHADLKPEYPLLSEAIGTTFDALLSRVYRPNKRDDPETAHATRVLNKLLAFGNRQFTSLSSVSDFQQVFEPIMRANYTMPIPTGRLAPSFENGLSPITEDLAPYIRAIMVFDGRLKQYRDSLNVLMSHEQPGRGEKRMRTTRASRAALEGGDKASTRKERWFPADTNYYLVQSTGEPEWQQLLFQKGHFRVQPMVESSEEGIEQPCED